MFWNEEDVQPAVNKAVELFGPVGRMAYGKNVRHNMSVATKEFGKIWYGDIDMDDATFTERCKALSTEIKQTLYLFSLDNSYDYSTPVSTN